MKATVSAESSFYFIFSLGSFCSSDVYRCKVLHSSLLFNKLYEKNWVILLRIGIWRLLLNAAFEALGFLKPWSSRFKKTWSLCTTLYNVCVVGGLFLNTEEREAQVFQLTAEDISSNHSILRGQLVALPELIEPHNSLKVSQSVCSLLQLGIAGIFGPHAGTTSPQVQSICDTMDIPHIETSWDASQQRQDFLVNLHPHPSILAKVQSNL